VKLLTDREKERRREKKEKQTNAGQNIHNNNNSNNDDNIFYLRNKNSVYLVQWSQKTVPILWKITLFPKFPWLPSACDGHVCHPKHLLFALSWLSGS